MPLYEFECDTCHKVTERIQKYSDPPMETCPACGGPVKKLLSSPAIQFKGTGWYITDYARKSGNGSGKSISGESDKSEKKESGESGKSEKPETKKTESTTTPSKSDT